MKVMLGGGVVFQDISAIWELSSLRDIVASVIWVRK
jgi:hypothetical protein